jgi:tetratricopeptide (TPR) repeat protein
MSDYAALRRLLNRSESTTGEDTITTRDEPDPNTKDPGDRLDGWKRIAAYLGKDVRTLRRWEKNEGLPIRRLMHDKQGTVYAFRSELEAWRKSRGQAKSPEAPQPAAHSEKSLTRWLAIAAVFLTIALAATWSLTRDTTPEPGDAGWVLITQFDNRTGEPGLDGTLEYAMERELSNSRHIKVLPRFRINDALQLMQLPPDTVVDSVVGREVALRDGQVRYLVNGRIEKLGEAYALYSDLVTPADGVIHSSYTAEIQDAASILSGVRQIAAQIRETLGEGAGSIERSTEELERVTTPSLEALKLYSQANTMMMGIDRERAVPVLRQALRIDPDFASAHLLLFYVLRDRGEIDAGLSHLERAVELAEDTTERERLFILATYYQFYLEDIPRAIETFELLARLYPDHFWAVSNLASLNEKLGYHDRAYPYQLRRADLRPGLGWHVLEAARAAAIYGDRQTRQVYAERVREAGSRVPWIAPHVAMLPYQTLWLDGDYDALKVDLDRWTSSSEWSDAGGDGTERYLVQSLYLSVGDMAAFRKISQEEISGSWLEAIVDRDGGEPATLEEHLDLAPNAFWTATLLASTGRTAEARTMLDHPETSQINPMHFSLRDRRNLAEGELALADGRCDDASRLLAESVPNVRYRSKRHYLFGARSLAEALVCTGNIDEAVEVLEQAQREKEWSIFEYAATYLWFSSQLYLLDLYDQTNEPTKRAALAAEIEQLLTAADADFPVVQKLSVMR